MQAVAARSSASGIIVSHMEGQSRRTTSTTSTTTPVQGVSS